MHILTVGLNHKTTPLELREQLSFSSPALCSLLGQINNVQSKMAQAKDDGGTPHESVVVSTCNRLEYYGVVQNPETATEKIIKLISRASQIEADVFRPHLYRYEDKESVTHLMRVAAGLDSMVLGEAQILGQLVQAYQSATTHNTTSTILNRLFQNAIHAGKRARTETDINLNAASVSSVAIRLAQQHLGDLSNQVVMVLGAGEMGILAVKALLNRGVKKLLIVNRNKARAERLAEQWGATALTFDQIETGLKQADLVITSTAAPHLVLHRNQVIQAMKNRTERPLLIVDIALPRDVETSINDLPNVHLYNLDDLQMQVEDTLRARRAEIPKVEAILDKESKAFINWYHTLHVVPTITSLREQFEDIREQELNRALNRLKDLDEREQKIVVELSRRLMNKFLHQPTVRLRAEAARGNGVAYTSALQDLFELKVELS